MAHSFIVVVSKTWNDLSHSIKSLSSMGRFVAEDCVSSNCDGFSLEF
jgi:hypothetical protein